MDEEDEEIEEGEPNQPKEDDNSVLGYYRSLKPYFYKDAEAARNLTFKDFMRTHVRYLMPGVYNNLVAGQPALEKWADREYLKSHLGSSYVYGIHYMNEPPSSFYAHDNIFSNQRGEYQTFDKFMEEFLVKFEDEKLKDKSVVTDMIWR
jgi:hypothetical protein